MKFLLKMALIGAKLINKKRIFRTPAGGPGAAAPPRTLTKLCRAEIKFLFEKLAQKLIFLKKIFLNFIKIWWKNLKFWLNFLGFWQRITQLIKIRCSEAKNPKVFENLQENLSKYLISNCLKNWKFWGKTRILWKNNEIFTILFGNPVGNPGQRSSYRSNWKFYSKFI